MFRSIGGLFDSIIGTIIFIVLAIVLFPLILLGLIVVGIPLGIWALIKLAIDNPNKTSPDTSLAKDPSKLKLEDLDPELVSKLALDDKKLSQVATVAQQIQTVLSKQDGDKKLSEEELKEMRHQVKKELRDMKKEFKADILPENKKEIKQELLKYADGLTKDNSARNVLLFQNKAKPENQKKAEKSETHEHKSSHHAQKEKTPSTSDMKTSVREEKTEHRVHRHRA